MPQTVLITRAEPGASETQARLEALGYVVRKSPALTIAFHDAGLFDPPGAEDVYIFTSANGVRAVAGANWPLNLPAVCVGPSTLDAARAAGAKTLYHANGNADDVFELICRRFEPTAGIHFLHVANEDAAGDLATRLSAAGYAVRFVPLYKARPSEWHEVNVDGLGAIFSRATVLIHSAKAAEAVANWLSMAGIPTENMKLVGISERALRPLAAFQFAQMAWASHPNENELIKALQTIAEPSVSSAVNRTES